MAYIDSLYSKQEQIYRDCCEINNCSECWHNNGKGRIDCDLTNITKEIETEYKKKKENLPQFKVKSLYG